MAAAHILPGLPDEVVVWEILVRLPPKALLRCRAVRRAWRLATSTRDFLLAHHARQPTTPLLHGYNCAGDVVESLDIIPLDNVAGADQLQYSARLRMRRVYGHGLLLQDSCDGLLLLSLYSTHFSIYNPATQYDSDCLPDDTNNESSSSKRPRGGKRDKGKRVKCEESVVQDMTRSLRDMSDTMRFTHVTNPNENLFKIIDDMEEYPLFVRLALQTSLATNEQVASMLKGRPMTAIQEFVRRWVGDNFPEHVNVAPDV